MAEQWECDQWRQQLAEKRSYLDTWRGNETEAQNEYGKATTEKWQADSNLTTAQNEVTRTGHLVDHWYGKKTEAEGMASDLRQAYQDLEWKISSNCGN